ncbi:MAG: alpha/beta hydrolase [Oscillochloridaceae bacterium umkhey_bin13]
MAVLAQTGDEWAAHYGRYEASSATNQQAPLLGGRPFRERTFTGTIITVANVYSPQLDNRRDITIYLPPGYDQGQERFPVVYMQDGQNLFDASSSFSGVEWGVDEAMEALAERGVRAIVVGIANMGARRMLEYSPFEHPDHGPGLGDAYLAFLADTLKPYLDRSFRTRPNPSNTLIVGSSMGGLISLYALLCRPDVFGKVGALSPSLWYAERAIFQTVREAAKGQGVLYMDVGSAEGDVMQMQARQLARILSRHGYQAGTNLRFNEIIGAGHNEAAWSNRIGPALAWLLGAPHQRRRR